MSKKRRNILIAGFVLLIACYCSSLAFLGTGSPFDAGGLFGSDTRRLLFGDDNIVRRSELNTNCLLGDGTLEFDGGCDIDIDGTDENVDFDVPRDLRLTMCWGAMLVSMDSENISVDESPLPTERNDEALSLNIFHEGDSEIDLDCETDSCRVAVNDAACPIQPQIPLDAVTGCSVNSAGIINLQGACTMTVDSNEGDEDNPNTAAFDRDENPRGLSIRFCSGDMLLSVSSDEEMMPDYSVRMPEQSRLWTVDIYGEDISTMNLLCLPNQSCVLALREASCPS